MGVANSATMNEERPLSLNEDPFFTINGRDVFDVDDDETSSITSDDTSSKVSEDSETTNPPDSPYPMSFTDRPQPSLVERVNAVRPRGEFVRLNPATKKPLHNNKPEKHGHGKKSKKRGGK